MQYLLTKEEYEKLDYAQPYVDQIKDLDAALEENRQLIVKLAKVDCGNQYCVDCPISDTVDRDIIESNLSPLASDLTCRRTRRYPK
ncbi:hypothetical protein N9112_00430 [bacterium]|nr:hypothetical protein [bacterium]